MFRNVPTSPRGFTTQKSIRIFADVRTTAVIFIFFTLNSCFHDCWKGGGGLLLQVSIDLHAALGW